MRTKKVKKIVSLFLAVLMCVTIFAGFGTTAYAAEETDEVYLISFPRDGDDNYGGEWGHGSHEFMNGWSTDTSRYTSVYAMGSYNGNICYCIEIGVPLKTGDRFTKKGENFWDNYPSSYNKTISPDDIKLFIGRIMQYGYTGTISTSWRSQNEGGDKLAHAVATQLLIWETVVGERDADFNKVDTGGKDAILDQISVNHPLRSKIMSYYNSTPDGTLRYQDEQVVARLQTGQDGTATTEPLYLGTFKISEEKAAHGMVISNEIKTVELTYAGENIEMTSAEVSFYNERQKAEISLSKIIEQNELFGIGNNGEILSVQFGLFADEELTAADGSVIPKDGLLEIANCDENGKAVFKTDIPVGAKLYVKEIAADNHYILSDEKYPIVFNYAGQDTALVEIKVNDGEPIENEIIYGSIKGLKIDRETQETIEGALFGLFKADETEFTKEKALLTAESKEDGVFTFENVPYGSGKDGRLIVAAAQL